MALRYHPPGSRDSVHSSKGSNVYDEDDTLDQSHNYTTSHLGVLPDDVHEVKDQVANFSSSTVSARMVGSKGSLFHRAPSDIHSADQFAEKAAKSLQKLVSPRKEEVFLRSSVAPVFQGTADLHALPAANAPPLPAPKPSGNLTPPFRSPAPGGLPRPYLSPRRLGKGLGSSMQEDAIKSIESMALFRAPRNTSTLNDFGRIASKPVPEPSNDVSKTLLQPPSQHTTGVSSPKIGSIASNGNQRDTSLAVTPASRPPPDHHTTGASPVAVDGSSHGGHARPAYRDNGSPELPSEVSGSHWQVTGRASPPMSSASCMSPVVSSAPRHEEPQTNASKRPEPPAATTETVSTAPRTSEGSDSSQGLSLEQQQQQMLLSLQNLQPMQLLPMLPHPFLGSLASPAVLSQLQGLNAAQLGTAQLNAAQLNAAHINAAQMNAAQMNAAQMNAAHQMAYAQFANPLSGFNTPPLSGIQLLQQQAARILAGAGNHTSAPMNAPTMSLPPLNVQNNSLPPTPTALDFNSALGLASANSLLSAFNAAALLSGASSTGVSTKESQSTATTPRAESLTTESKPTATDLELLAQLEDLKGQVKRLESSREELEQLKTQLKNAETSREEVEQLKTQLKKSEVSHAEVEQLKSQLKKSEVSRDEVEELKTQLKKAEAYRTEVEELKAQLRQAETSQGQLENLKAQLERVENSRDELARETGQVKALNAKLEVSLSSQERTIKQIEEEKEQLKVRCKEVEAKAETLTQLLETAPERSRAEKGALQQEATRAQENARQHQEQAQRHEEQVRRYKAMLDKEKRELDSLREFTELERSTLVRRIEELEDVISKQNTSASFRDTHIKNLERQLAELQNQLDATARKASTRSSQLGQVQEQTEVQQQHILRLEAECRRLEEHALRSDRELAATKRELNELTEGSGRMFRQVKGLSQALDRHAPLLPKSGDLSSLVHHLHDWVQQHQRTFDSRGGVHGSLAHKGSTAGMGSPDSHSITGLASHKGTRIPSLPLSGSNDRYGPSSPRSEHSVTLSSSPPSRSPSVTKLYSAPAPGSLSPRPRSPAYAASSPPKKLGPHNTLLPQDGPLTAGRMRSPRSPALRQHSVYAEPELGGNRTPKTSLASKLSPRVREWRI